MLFTVQHHAASLGVVDLPLGPLVAGRLEPSPNYTAVADVVRQATDAFLHLGLFDSVAPLYPPIPAGIRRWRRAMARAARLQLGLVGVYGDQWPTQFVNLLEAPADHGIVVIASFVRASAPIDAPLRSIPTVGTGYAPPAA